MPHVCLFLLRTCEAGGRGLACRLKREAASGLLPSLVLAFLRLFFFPCVFFVAFFSLFFFAFFLLLFLLLSFSLCLLPIFFSKAVFPFLSLPPLLSGFQSFPHAVDSTFSCCNLARSSRISRLASIFEAVFTLSFSSFSLVCPTSSLNAWCDVHAVTCSQCWALCILVTSYCVVVPQEYRKKSDAGRLRNCT